MGNEIERAESSLEHLYGSGGLSDESAQALEKVELDGVGQALGDVSSSPELLLVSVLVDDSTSIARNIDDIRFGYGRLLEALRTKSFDAEVRVHARAMNRGVISPYTALVEAPSLTDHNYSGSNLAPVTPLYLQSVLLLGTVLLKAQEEEDRGARVRTFTLIITDGEDNKSGDITVRDVRAMVVDMLDFSTNHIVAGMGVGERSAVDFRDIFDEMSIPKDRRYTPGTSVKRLQEAFDDIAELLQLAASSETDFAQLLPGSPSD